MTISKDPKYVCFQNGYGEHIVIFPNLMQHANMVFNLGVMGRPISAGFINKDLVCYGESTSLKLKAREEDTEIVKEMFRK